MREGKKISFIPLWKIQWDFLKFKCILKNHFAIPIFNLNPYLGKKYWRPQDVHSLERNLKNKTEFHFKRLTNLRFKVTVIGFAHCQLHPVDILYLWGTMTFLLPLNLDNGLSSIYHSSENLHCRYEVVPIMYTRCNFIKTSCSHDVHKWHAAAMIEDNHNFSFTGQNSTLCRENTQQEVKNGWVSKVLTLRPCVPPVMRHPPPVK